jgi:hypothetical protein
LLCLFLCSIKNDAEKFYQLATELNCGEQGNSKVTLNINYLKLFSKTCRGDLSPIKAIIGGITAQEAMKVGVLVRL